MKILLKSYLHSIPSILFITDFVKQSVYNNSIIIIIFRLIKSIIIYCRNSILLVKTNYRLIY